MSPSWRTEHPLAWSASLAVRLGGGHVGHGAHLVQGQLPGAQRADQVRDVPGLLTHMGQRPPVVVETPKRSTTQVSGDVAPSSRYAWRRAISPNETTIFPATAAIWRKNSSRPATSSPFGLGGHRGNQVGTGMVEVWRSRVHHGGRVPAPARVAVSDLGTARHALVKR